MKYSDLKVGMKVKDKVYGLIYTIRDITTKNMFSVEEQPSTYFYNSEYFKPVEETKEKQTMNTESKLISMDKKYKTRCGYPVRVLCVDRNDSFWPVVALCQRVGGESIQLYSDSGVSSLVNDRGFDLIEVSPYEDFKKDDKVMVSEDGIIWYKRYFSHATVKGAYVFDNGYTSWTEPNGDTTNWSYCRKPTQEELGE